MNEVAQDVTVETPIQDTPVDQNDQAQPTDETDEQSPDVDESESKAEEPQETAEQRLARLEKDYKSKEKAINRKTAAYHDLQRAHERTLRDFQELQKQLQVNDPSVEPNIDDFDTHAEYMEAVKKHVADTAKQEALKEIEQQTLMQQHQKIEAERVQLVNRQEAEFLAIEPDYKHAKSEFDDFIKLSNVNKHVEIAIVQQAFKGNVPQLINYFGKNNGENIDKLQEIVSMTPVEAAVEIYKIQQMLEAPVKKDVKPAPKPVNKPRGGGAPSKDLSKGDVLVNLGLK